MSNWILLRGLTRESRHWGRFPEIFREALPDAGTHAIDLPGNGSRHRERSPADVAAMAEACRASLRARGIDPPYHLLAMSLGAMVAVAWADRHADEIAACVLVNTSLRPFSPFYRRLRPGAYLPLVVRLVPGGSDRRRESAILRLTCRQLRFPECLLDDWVAYRRQYPVSAGNALRQLFAAARYRAPPERPRTPMLVLAGRRDALVDPNCSRRIAERWRTAFAEHPTAGHDLPQDDGAWVAARVREWLASLTPPP